MIAVQCRPVERPIWKADGLPADRLPFFGGKLTTNSLELPYEDLRVIWAPTPHGRLRREETETACERMMSKIWIQP